QLSPRRGRHRRLDAAPERACRRLRGGRLLGGPRPPTVVLRAAALDGGVDQRRRGGEGLLPLLSLLVGGCGPAGAAGCGLERLAAEPGRRLAAARPLGAGLGRAAHRGPAPLPSL